MIGRIYLAVLVLLAVHGVHRLALVAIYWRGRRRGDPRPRARYDDAALPVVTVQLPIFNELHVVERLLEAAAALDWPRDRLEIQVLDDSTDETQALAAAKVASLCARGIDARHVHRRDRTGFKAGALANGLSQARGELLLVLDADFVPPPDLLRRTVDHFTDPAVGMVQVRWEHLNRTASALTHAQALLLDAHFVIEQGARHGAGLYFNFNGTAGVWRREAISGAGGWHHDTLTEDMDLSYRALLAGWRFVYLSDVVAPAELPAEMNAWKGQQFRWAKGSIQVAKKLLPSIVRADVPRRVKREALLHLTANLSYPLMLLLCVLLVPAVLQRTATLAVDLPICALTLLSLATYYVASQRAITADRPGGAWAALARLPVLMAVGCGLCVNQARAVGEALWGTPSEFVRTPKQGSAGASRYKGARTWVPIVELALAAYNAIGAVLAVRGGQWLALPFLLLFAFGFTYVGTLSIARR